MKLFTTGLEPSSLGAECRRSTQIGEQVPIHADGALAAIPPYGKHAAPLAVYSFRAMVTWPIGLPRAGWSGTRASSAR